MAIFSKGIGACFAAGSPKRTQSCPADQQRLVLEVLSDESVRAKDVAWALA